MNIIYAGSWLDLYWPVWVIWINFYGKECSLLLCFAGM